MLLHNIHAIFLPVAVYLFLEVGTALRVQKPGNDAGVDVPIYVMQVNWTDGYRNADYAVEALANVACTAKIYRFPGKLIALTAGLSDEYMVALQKGVFHIVNATGRIDFMKSIHKPIYTLAEVEVAGIRYPDERPGSISIKQLPLQARADLLQDFVVGADRTRAIYLVTCDQLLGRCGIMPTMIFWPQKR